MRVHVLLLHAGGQRYALPSASVVEVVPAVPLREVPGVPSEVAGLLHYRGRVVPVVDLAGRLRVAPPPATFSTRIVVCLRPGSPVDTATRRLLGIRAGDVTRVGVLDPEAPGSHPGVLPDGLRALGRVTRDEEGLVQLVELEGLLGTDLLARLDSEVPVPGDAPAADEVAT